MAYVKLPGSARRYFDTSTQTEISRREYQKRIGNPLTSAKTGNKTSKRNPRRTKGPNDYTQVKFSSQAEMEAWIEKHPKWIEGTKGYITVFGKNQALYPSGAETQDGMIERNVTQKIFTDDIPSQSQTIGAQVQRIFAVAEKFLLKYK